MDSNGRVAFVYFVPFVVVGCAMIGAILWAAIASIKASRAGRSSKIVPEAIPWQGTTSSVQNDQDPLEARCVFILLGTTMKPDGSEERFEKSVELRRRASQNQKAGAIFNGRQVTVYGKEDESGWIRATKIVDKETGAATE